MFAALLVLIAVPQLALAHAVLLSSSPEANAVVAEGKTKLVLRYNARVDAKRSTLTLVAPDGNAEPLPLDTQEAPNLLRTTAAHLRKGAYTVRWQVLSSDGHVTRGTLAFSVR